MRSTAARVILLSLAVAFAACSREEAPRQAVVPDAGPGPIVKAGDASASPAVAAPTAGLPESGAPAIAFDAKEFDFGSVDQGETVEHVFTFRNTGNADLVIEKVRSS